MHRFVMVLGSLLVLSGCGTVEVTDGTGGGQDSTGTTCAAYCVEQQAYACNEQGVIVAAQECGEGTQCKDGACLPVQPSDADAGGAPDGGVAVPDAGGPDPDTTPDPDGTPTDPDATPPDPDGTPTDPDATPTDADALCEPECEGKSCGDDGCGGSCGPCDELGGEVCEAGQCTCAEDAAFTCVDEVTLQSSDSCGNPTSQTTCTDGQQCDADLGVCACLPASSYEC
ncbi:MAG: hypothetical protein QF464_23805, partial [Myxococcota bacterium]|nr:hypothetical protein [Myxococcota bacterium]